MIETLRVDAGDWNDAEYMTRRRFPTDDELPGEHRFGVTRCSRRERFIRGYLAELAVARHLGCEDRWWEQKELELVRGHGLDDDLGCLVDVKHTMLERLERASTMSLMVKPDVLPGVRCRTPGLRYVQTFSARPDPYRLYAYGWLRLEEVEPLAMVKQPAGNDRSLWVPVVKLRPMRTLVPHEVPQATQGNPPHAAAAGRPGSHRL